MWQNQQLLQLGGASGSNGKTPDGQEFRAPTTHRTDTSFM